MNGGKTGGKGRERKKGRREEKNKRGDKERERGTGEDEKEMIKLKRKFSNFHHRKRDEKCNR